MNSLRLYLAVLGGASAGLVAFLFWLRSHRKNAEQRERERRDHITRIGRITDGTVLDVHETSDEVHGLTQLLIYRYDVSGVAYECAQEVTQLRQFVDLYSCRLGLLCSVKYDPHNPGNSIVISENWTGLRKTPVRSYPAPDITVEPA